MLGSLLVFVINTFAVKSLEINQSIASGYLADLTTRYGEAFAAIQQTLERVDKSHLSLLRAVRATARTASVQQERLENEMRAEMEQRLSSLSSNISRELRVLREALLTLQAEKSDEGSKWFDIVVASIVGAVVVCIFIGTGHGAMETLVNPRTILSPASLRKITPVKYTQYVSDDSDEELDLRNDPLEENDDVRHSSLKVKIPPSPQKKPPFQLKKSKSFGSALSVKFDSRLWGAP